MTAEPVFSGIGIPEERASLPMPISLSPSSMGTFTSCPLAFRFSYIERLPEPPSAPASKGTLVHLALQHLMWRPPEQRTIEHALSDLDRARAELAADAEFAQMELSPEEWDTFHADAEKLVHRYFELEDPSSVRVLGVELRVSAETRDGVLIRGIIDRLELDENDELVVTDYKTGSAPSEGWEQKSMAGVHIYSLLCERMFGRRPSKVQLLYLSKPEFIVTAPSDQSLRGVEVKSGAVMQAVRTACARNDFRPRPSGLCSYCSFQEFCPSFGGRPELAREVLLARQDERDGHPQLPLAFGVSHPFLERVAKFDHKADDWFARFRNKKLDGIAYSLSSAADHSLLWHAVGATRGLLRGGDLEGAARFSLAIGVESALTNGVIKSAFERMRPADYAEIEFRHGLRRPITSSFPSGHATAAFCAAALLGGGPVAYSAAAAVSATRVYVRLHHASDVIAGAAFGLALGLALRPLVNRAE